MKFIYSSENETYCAPILGNGSVSFQIAPDGSMNPDSTGKLIHANIGRAIFWEGKRCRSIQTKNLIPFGRFTQSLGNLLPTEAEQSLDPDSAEISCRTLYNDGTVLDTAAFLCADQNLIVLKKTFTPASDFIYSFTYTLCDRSGAHNAYFSTSVKDNIVSWKALDQQGCEGQVAVFSDTLPDASEGADNMVTLSFNIDSPRTVCFYILLTDSPTPFAEGRRSEILAEGFDHIRETHRAAWSDFYSKGWAKTGNETIDRVYKMALYHLKCYATPWSMPVGLSDSCWSGRFFAFDEHYIFQGLITSNHFDEAVRVPRFRKNGLAIAVKRASSNNKHAARYPWETIEDGTEASPPGFYYDHIFHMAMVALSEYEYYLFSLDEDFLRETAYPVIEACAEFYRDQCLYDLGDRLIVGKCTDLERLGSGVANAYMTTCGVISTLRVYTEASERLGVNSGLAKESSELADRLFASLPNDGERYIPYPGCSDRSISAFSGTFPFDVIPRGDRLQSNAIDDYLSHEDIFGNMYSVGRGVCSWYACWKSVVFTRLGRHGEAFDSIDYVAGTAGDFGELFEINNKKSRTYYHPWFTTAAGMYVHAVNEMLVRNVGGELIIAEGLGSLNDFAFRIAVKGGMVVEVKVAGGKLETLKVERNQNCRAESIKVRLPERLGGEMTVALKQH